MRVWLVQRAEPTPHDSQGVQRKLRTGLMAEFFVNADHDVTWFTSSFDHYNRRQRTDRTQTREVRSGYRICYLKTEGFRRNVSIARLLDEGAQAREFARQAEILDPPDLIICSLPSVAMASVAADYAERHEVPLVCDVRDLWPDVFLDLVPRWLRPIASPLVAYLRRKLGRVLERSEMVTGLTDEYIDWAFRYSVIQRRECDIPLAMAYMPKEAISISSAKLAELQACFGLESVALEILFVGTIGPMMQFGPVIEAAKILQCEGVPAHFRLCGDGSGLDDLKGRAKGLHNVTLTGWVDEREINYLLGRSHAGLLPYAPLDAFRWSIPNKFGEYLSGSLALLHNLSGSTMSRLIENYQTGFVYDDNAKSLARAVRTLASDSVARQTYRQNSSALYRSHFHGPSIYGAFVERMETLIANRGVTSQFGLSK